MRCQKQNVYSTDHQYNIQIFTSNSSYFEIKPPPTGTVSRIDNCSLRDVTTCCQTVFASKLVLFGLRLKMSSKEKENKSKIRRVKLHEKHLDCFQKNKQLN